MSADKLSLCVSAAFLNSAMSTFPCASVPTVTIFIPHMAALAGFVPCAETGMMQTLRCASPRACMQMHALAAVGHKMNHHNLTPKHKNDAHSAIAAPSATQGTGITKSYKMVGPDNHEPCILASRTCIGLQGHGVEASDLTQEVTELLEHFLYDSQYDTMRTHTGQFKQPGNHIAKPSDQRPSSKAQSCHNSVPHRVSRDSQAEVGTETASSEGCRTRYLIPLNLILGRKRMQIRQFGPGHRDHFGGGIQLHRAGAQGDHTMNQRQILCLQPVKVSEQLMLRVVLVEDWMRKIRRGSLQAGGKMTLHSSGDLLSSEVNLNLAGAIY